MRNVPRVLAQVAALLTVSACGTSGNSVSGCPTTPPKQLTISAEAACAVASGGRREGSSPVFPQCHDACGGDFAVCTMPASFTNAYDAAVADGGASMTIDVNGVPTKCPVAAAPVEITCQVDCTGRRTQGSEELAVGTQLSAGEYLAACAHLEAVSVHAFERLAEELAAHGAPTALVAAARLAALEEIRHTDVTARLARGFGADVVLPSAPLHAAPRTLFAIALENAVEGCVRETYGAALALVRATRAADPDVRSALSDIARDECSHADLSWQIKEWADGRLDARQRIAIDTAMEEAVTSLTFSDAYLSDAARRACGVPSAAEQVRLAALVDGRLIRAAA